MSTAVSRGPNRHESAVLLVILLAAIGCSTSRKATGPAFEGPRPPGALEVRLHFDETADLDLFVTDPAKEAVYFGNNPSRGGGRLSADRRCRDASPRVEIVRFDHPVAGRYRVGVSHDRACGFRREPAAFRIEVEADGVSLEHEGVVAAARFEPIVLEFDWPGDRP